MLKFDTSDKKPKLFDLFIPVAIAAVVAGILAASGAHEHAVAIGITIILLCLIVIIRMLTAFVGQLHYNPYSYNTIYYMGFALFILSIMITQIILTVRMARDPDLYRVHEVMGVLMNSAKNYMILSLPFILVFATALCISNISLIRHEGRRFVNVLGIILSFLLVAGEAFLLRYDYYVSGSARQVMIHDLIANLFAAVYLYFECMLIGTIIANIIVVRYEPDPDKDFLIILGCGMQKDGKPTPLLRGRIDRAIAFYRKQKEMTGKELIFIPSGGQGPREVVSESECMKQYLLSQGIPEERIVKEDQSRNTFENMTFSKAKIEEIDASGKVAFSTTNYHVFRSGMYARRVKMRALGMGAKTKWYFWPNAAVREFVDLLTRHRLKQGLILGSMVVCYIIMTILAYR